MPRASRGPRASSEEPTRQSRRIRASEEPQNASPMQQLPQEGRLPPMYKKPNKKSAKKVAPIAEEQVEGPQEPVVRPAASIDDTTSSIELSADIYTCESPDNLITASAVGRQIHAKPESYHPKTVEEDILHRALLKTQLDLVLTMQKNFALSKKNTALLEKNAWLDEKLRSNATTVPSVAKRPYDDQGEDSNQHKKQRIEPVQQRAEPKSVAEFRRDQQIRNKPHLAGNRAAVKFTIANMRVPADEERAMMSEAPFEATIIGSPDVQQPMEQSPLQSAQLQQPTQPEQPTQVVQPAQAAAQTQPATTPRRFGLTNMLGSIGSAVARTLTLTPRANQPAQTPATVPAHITTTAPNYTSPQHAVQNVAATAATAATYQAPVEHEAISAQASQHDIDDYDADYDVPATPTPAFRNGIDTSVASKPSTTAAVGRVPGSCARRLRRLKQKTAERQAKEAKANQEREFAMAEQNNARLDAETEADLQAAHARRAQQASYDRNQDRYSDFNADTEDTPGGKRKLPWWKPRPGEFDTLPKQDNGWVNINGKMVDLSEDDHETQQQPPLKRRATGVQWDPVLERGPVATPFSRMKGEITSILKPSYRATTGPSLTAGDPHCAQPYLGKLFADKSSYSDDEEEGDDTVEVAKQKVPSKTDYISIGHTHHIWTGPKITPQPGSFSVPDDSDDETDDSDRDTSIMSTRSDFAPSNRSPQVVMENEVPLNNKFGQTSSAASQESPIAASFVNIFAKTSSTPVASPADSEALKRARLQAEKYKPKTPSGLSASSRISSSPLVPDVESVGKATFDAALSTTTTRATSEPEPASAYYQSLEYAKDLANQMAGEIPSSAFVWPTGKHTPSWDILTDSQREDLREYAQSEQSQIDGDAYWKEVYENYKQEKAATTA